MFYSQFIKLCKKRGISPSAVTREIGLNNSSATAWKRGSIPKGETLQKLANYFGVSVDYLFDIGPRINPISSSRRIFSVMSQKNISLEEISQLTKISTETIRTFALGEKVGDGRDCLKKIAKALDTSHAYLMGWTNHKEDDEAYYAIDPEMWKLAGNDPDAAHGLQQFAEDEKYHQAMDAAENARRGLAVIKYLEEMGFTVTGSILKSHHENQIDESGQIIGQSEIADEIGTVLSKDGLTATFTDVEFEELQAVAKEAIEGRFYKKVLEQQKK